MRRRQRSLTNSSASRGEGYANLVRGMEIDRPFQVISSDISYIRTDEGFAYLCQIRDVASGMILAAGMSDHMKADGFGTLKLTTLEANDSRKLTT